MTYNWNSGTRTLTITYYNNQILQSPSSYKYRAVKIIISEGFTEVATGCFEDFTALESLSLPDSITKVGNNIIARTKIKVLHIPLNLKFVDDHQSFDNSYVFEEFTIDPNQENFAVVEGVLYSKDLKTLVYYPGGKKNKVVEIPQGTEILSCACISFSYNVEEIIIPPSVAYIQYTFPYYLPNLKKCTVINNCSNYSSLYWDPNYRFDNCKIKYNSVVYVNLSYIPILSSNSTHLTIIPNSNCTASVQINDNLFKDNNEIETIQIAYGIESIVGDCFSGCSKLTKVVIPETLTSIDKNAFKNSKIHSVYSSVIYPKNKLDILMDVFSSYSLGLQQISLCHNHHYIKYLFFSELLI